MKKSFITVKLDNFNFGIDVAFVREVNRNVEISPVALAPDFTAGLMNLRGQIITIIDPGVKLSLSKRQFSKKSYCVILKTSSEITNKKLLRSFNETIGLLIDTVGDIVIVDDSEIDPLPPNINQIDSEYINGVVRLENSLLIILAIDKILENNNREISVQNQ